MHVPRLPYSPCLASVRAGHVIKVPSEFQDALLPDASLHAQVVQGGVGRGRLLLVGVRLLWDGCRAEREFLRLADLVINRVAIRQTRGEARGA